LQLFDAVLVAGSSFEHEQQVFRVLAGAERCGDLAIQLAAAAPLRVSERESASRSTRKPGPDKLRTLDARPPSTPKPRSRSAP
jgi:hypothetical protein